MLSNRLNESKFIENLEKCQNFCVTRYKKRSVSKFEKINKLNMNEFQPIGEINDNILFKESLSKSNIHTLNEQMSFKTFK